MSEANELISLHVSEGNQYSAELVDFSGITQKTLIGEAFAATLSEHLPDSHLASLRVPNPRLVGEIDNFEDLPEGP